jgi:plasmid stability protein
MATITIRKLDELTKKRLRVRAARHGRSMEEEARHLLRAVLSKEDGATAPDFAEHIRARFQAVGGVELRLPRREPIREPPKPGR